MTSKTVLAMLASAAIALSAGTAAASSAISLVTPGDLYSGDGITLGFEFSVLTHQSVTALGAFDDNNDGLKGRAEVGLWDTDGNLLLSTFVPAGTVGTLDGGFRFQSVTPFALIIGKHYIVGALDSADMESSWATGNNGTAALNPEMNFYGDRFKYDSSLSFPGDTNGHLGAWLGGNVFTEQGAVPEPATWTLMIGGFGLAGAALRRRRASAVAA